jgi:hypothetical protein
MSEIVSGGAMGRAGSILSRGDVASIALIAFATAKRRTTLAEAIGPQRLKPLQRTFQERQRERGGVW